MSIGPPRGEGDWEQFTTLEGNVFGTTAEWTSRYIDAVRDHAIARFAVEDGRVVAGALAFPCTQLFGGREVTSGAVASVCVAPERRGAGLGRSVMWSLVGAMREAKLAVAPLWPSSVGFYRGMGWELGGTVQAYAVPADLLRADRAAGTAVDDPDREAVRAVRDAVLCEWSGPIVRPGWWWDWRRPVDPPELTHRLGWVEDGRLTGVLTYTKDTPRERRWGYDLTVTEFWTTTSDALSGLMGLLATEGPLSPTITFAHAVLPPTPDLQWRVADVGLPLAGTNAWMLRVLDPAQALREAGWPPEATDRLAIEVAGIGQPPARMAVAFTGGRAQVDPGERAQVRMAAGAFAAWYCGAMSATTAVRLRLAAGDDDAIRAMDRLTADRRPWHPDRY